MHAGSMPWSWRPMTRRIAAAVESFGGIVRLTQAAHRTGTDRIAEIANDLSCEILVNVQGDLPLIEPGMISEVLHPLITDPSVKMSTLRQATNDAARDRRARTS